MSLDDTRRTSSHLRLAFDNTTLVLEELLPPAPATNGPEPNSYSDFLKRAGGDQEVAFANYYRYVMEDCVHKY